MNTLWVSFLLCFKDILGEFTITDPVTKKRVKLDGYYKQPLTFDKRMLEKEVKSMHPAPANATDNNLLEVIANRKAELERLIQDHKDIGDYAESYADMRFRHHVFQYHGCMHHGHLGESCPMNYRDADKHPLQKSC